MNDVGVLGSVKPKVITSRTVNGVTLFEEEELDQYGKEHLDKIYG